jgi:hypothetical protein
VDILSLSKNQSFGEGAGSMSETSYRKIYKIQASTSGNVQCPAEFWYTEPRFATGIFLSLWLYNPILGLGRLHKTSISVTRSTTVGRTPWTGDKIVARPLLTAPGDCDDGEVGGMNGFWHGKPKYSEKTCLDATLSTTNLTCQTRARTRAAEVGSQRLTAWAMARPFHCAKFLYHLCTSAARHSWIQFWSPSREDNN